jgi:hypothetical protein
MTSAIASLLAGQSPPPEQGGGTPNVRKNPSHEWYVSLQRIRMTARDALVKSDEQEPVVKDFLVAVGGVCDKLLAGAKPAPAIASGLARAVESYSPQAAQQLDMFVLMQVSQPALGAAGMGAPGGPPPMGQAPQMPQAGGQAAGAGPFGAAPPTPSPGPGGAALA